MPYAADHGYCILLRSRLQVNLSIRKEKIERVRPFFAREPGIPFCLFFRIFGCWKAASYQGYDYLNQTIHVILSSFLFSALRGLSSDN